MTPLPQEKKFTAADLLDGPEDRRQELIDGYVYDMAPPSRAHQQIIGEIFRQIANYLQGKRCKVYPAPFGVRLFEDADETPGDSDTLVEPDISIICDPSKLDTAGCKGAPDMVAEILSPSTKGMDRLTKFNLYQRAGVREYWIVSPEEKAVQVFLLREGHYDAVGYYGPEDTVKVAVLEDCTVDLGPVFEE